MIISCISKQKKTQECKGKLIVKNNIEDFRNHLSEVLEDIGFQKVNKSNSEYRYQIHVDNDFKIFEINTIRYIDEEYSEKMIELIKSFDFEYELINRDENVNCSFFQITFNVAFNEIAYPTKKSAYEKS